MVQRANIQAAMLKKLDLEMEANKDFLTKGRDSRFSDFIVANLSCRPHKSTGKQCMVSKIGQVQVISRKSLCTQYRKARIGQKKLEYILDCVHLLHCICCYRRDRRRTLHVRLGCHHLSHNLSSVVWLMPLNASFSNMFTQEVDKISIKDTHSRRMSLSHRYAYWQTDHTGTRCSFIHFNVTNAYPRTHLASTRDIQP